MAGKNGAIKLVAGNSSPALAEAIGSYLATPMTKAELDAWADDCVNLFLNGCRFWQPRAPGSQAEQAGPDGPKHPRYDIRYTRRPDGPDQRRLSLVRLVRDVIEALDADQATAKP